MTKAAILNFIQYICVRQDEYGPENAFMFRQYHDGKDMVRSEYGYVDEDEGAAERSKKQKAARKKSKGKKKQRVPLTVAIFEPDASAATLAHGVHVTSSYTLPSAGASDWVQDTMPSGETSNFIIPQQGDIIDYNIDPILRGSNDTLQNNNDASIVVRGQTPGNVIVNEEEMCLLLEQGHPAVQPINGPGDGLPKYTVTFSAYQHLRNITNTSSAYPIYAPLTKSTSVTVNENPIITRPRPKPKPVTKKVQWQPNDDTQMDETETGAHTDNLRRSVRGHPGPSDNDETLRRSLRNQGNSKTPEVLKTSRVAPRKKMRAELVGSANDWLLSHHKYIYIKKKLILQFSQIPNL
jgi:hypothetical protein